MDKQQLINGETLEFTNDDGDLLEVSYGRRLGGGKAFKVVFNAKVMSLTAGFAKAKKKAEYLTIKYALTEC